MPINDTWQNAALDQLTVGGAPEPPASRWFGLRYNGVEVAVPSSAYARVEITSATFWTPGTYALASNARVNADPLDFGTPTAAWGYVNELCLYDDELDTEPAKIFGLAEGGGAVYIENGVPVIFNPGEIILYIYDGG
jgi:hypothetical protein